jgi:hypothetical protein
MAESYKSGKNELTPRDYFTLAMIAFVIGYGVMDRHISDFRHYPVLLGIGFTLVVLFLNAVVWFGNSVPMPDWKRLIKKLPRAFLALVGASLFYYSIGVLVVDTTKWLVNPNSRTPISILLTMTATVTSGGLLFAFRLRARCIYGFSEALAGVTVVVHRVVTTDSKTAVYDVGFFLAILTAGIYLVVRGLDNIHQGLTKEPFDTYSLRFAERLGLVSANSDSRSGDPK